MGNKPARQLTGKKGYNQMVEDALEALKERPGSTQSDILQFLEEKYEKKIPAKKKRQLETVIRSEKIKSKRRGGGAGVRLPMQGFSRRRVGFKVKSGPRRKCGLCLPRGTKIQALDLELEDDLPIPKPLIVTRKPGKKSLVMPGGNQRQQIRGRPKGGTTVRGSTRRRPL